MRARANRSAPLAVALMFLVSVATSTKVQEREPSGADGDNFSLSSGTERAWDIRNRNAQHQNCLLHSHKEQANGLHGRSYLLDGLFPPFIERS